MLILIMPEGVCICITTGNDKQHNRKTEKDNAYKRCYVPFFLKNFTKIFQKVENSVDKIKNI
jgi:hypothetical protein